ncbi:MAG: acetylglutamate kinase [Planctomycetes bacterium]|nr:acetylglutamate kinase [Planctomycetota bacterium]
MQKEIEKAATLVEAMPHIQAFRDKIILVKLGGSAMDQEESLRTVLQDVVFMELVGMHPILVHGGGPAISAEMKKRGIEPTFVKGHRVTDEQVIDLVADVLWNQINADIVRKINDLGGRAHAVINKDRKTLQAKKKLMEIDGEQIDLGLVGAMVSIDARQILDLCYDDFIPVIAPISADSNGNLLNVQADEVAAFTAAQLKPEKIVYLSDTPGILRVPGDERSMASTLKEDEVNRLIAEGVIDGGMLPKVNACIQALEAGVNKAHIIDGRVPHSLLLEILTDKGIGTQILR